MSPVRAVTALVPTTRGHVQFYRDLDHHDMAREDALVGDFLSGEWPDPDDFRASRGPKVSEDPTREGTKQ